MLIRAKPSSPVHKTSRVMEIGPGDLVVAAFPHKIGCVEEIDFAENVECGVCGASVVLMPSGGLSFFSLFRSR